MKKVTLILAVIAFSITMFSCGGGNNTSEQKETVKPKTSENTKPVKNRYAKDKYLDLMGLSTVDNKFSQKDWDRISKVVKAFGEFKQKTKNKIATTDELASFFKKQGYTDYQEGKDDIIRFRSLYQIAIGIPMNIGSLRQIKQVYSEEQFKKSCKESGEVYNEAHLSAEDIKNIEKYTDVIGKAGSIKITIEAAEAYKNK